MERKMSVLEPVVTEQKVAGTIEVLIVDDNSVIRMGLRSLLDTSDAVNVVGEAADGVEAIEKIEQLKPDIALLDVRMPRRDGLEVVKEVHERVKVIMDFLDRKSTRLNSSHVSISYAVFCLKNKSYTRNQL